MKIHYTCFSLEDGSHITWQYGEKAKLPTTEGEPVEVRVVGKYKDEIVGCDIVKVTLLNGTVLTHQPNGTVLHITTFVDSELAENKDSGLRATENGWKPHFTINREVGISEIIKKNCIWGSILNFFKS